MKRFPKCLSTFSVKVNVSFTEEQLSSLRKHINMHYLGDKECNVRTEGGIVSKYPDKETPEYIKIMHMINRTFTVNVPIHFFDDGSMKFGAIPERGKAQ